MPWPAGFAAGKKELGGRTNNEGKGRGNEALAVQSPKTEEIAREKRPSTLPGYPTTLAKNQRTDMSFQRFCEALQN